VLAETQAPVTGWHGRFDARVSRRANPGFVSRPARLRSRLDSNAFQRESNIRFRWPAEAEPVRNTHSQFSRNLIMAIDTSYTNRIPSLGVDTTSSSSAAPKTPGEIFAALSTVARTFLTNEAAGLMGVPPAAAAPAPAAAAPAPAAAAPAPAATTTAAPDGTTPTAATSPASAAAAAPAAAIAPAAATAPATTAAPATATATAPATAAAPAATATPTTATAPATAAAPTVAPPENKDQALRMLMNGFNSTSPGSSRFVTESGLKNLSISDDDSPDTKAAAKYFLAHPSEFKAVAGKDGLIDSTSAAKSLNGSDDVGKLDKETLQTISTYDRKLSDTKGVITMDNLRGLAKDGKFKDGSALPEDLKAAISYLLSPSGTALRAQLDTADHLGAKVDGKFNGGDLKKANTHVATANITSTDAAPVITADSGAAA
jgi:hypothetical protein